MLIRVYSVAMQVFVWISADQGVAEQVGPPTILRVPTISLGGSIPTLLIAATKFAVRPTIPTIATRLSPLIQRKVSLRGRAP
jgi:hypothetical protein